MAQGPRSAGREGAPGSGPTAHGPCHLLRLSTRARLRGGLHGDRRPALPTPALHLPSAGLGVQANPCGGDPRPGDLPRPSRSDIFARGWEQQPRGDKVGTSRELRVQLGSEGSLTGAYGPVQERLDVLGDDAEHLDHCAETARREGRRAGPASPTPLPLHPPPGPTAFWLLPIAPAVALGGGGRHPYWPCLPQPRAAFRVCGHGATGRPRPAHRWRGRRAPA